MANPFFIEFASNAAEFSDELPGRLRGARDAINDLKKELRDFDSELDANNVGEGLAKNLVESSRIIGDFGNELRSMIPELRNVVSELRKLSDLQVSVDTAGIVNDIRSAVQQERARTGSSPGRKALQDRPPAGSQRAGVDVTSLASEISTLSDTTKVFAVAMKALGQSRKLTSEERKLLRPAAETARTSGGQDAAAFVDLLARTIGVQFDDVSRVAVDAGAAAERAAKAASDVATVVRTADQPARRVQPPRTDSSVPSVKGLIDQILRPLQGQGGKILPGRLNRLSDVRNAQEAARTSGSFTNRSGKTLQGDEIQEYLGKLTDGLTPAKAALVASKVEELQKQLEDGLVPDKYVNEVTALLANLRAVFAGTMEGAAEALEQTVGALEDAGIYAGRSKTGAGNRRRAAKVKPEEQKQAQSSRNEADATRESAAANRESAKAKKAEVEAVREVTDATSQVAVEAEAATAELVDATKAAGDLAARCAEGLAEIGRLNQEGFKKKTGQKGVDAAAAAGNPEPLRRFEKLKELAVEARASLGDERSSGPSSFRDVERALQRVVDEERKTNRRAAAQSEAAAEATGQAAKSTESAAAEVEDAASALQSAVASLEKYQTDNGRFRGKDAIRGEAEGKAALERAEQLVRDSGQKPFPQVGRLYGQLKSLAEDAAAPEPVAQETAPRELLSTMLRFTEGTESRLEQGIQAMRDNPERSGNEVLAMLGDIFSPALADVGKQIFDQFGEQGFNEIADALENLYQSEVDQDIEFSDFFQDDEVLAAWNRARGAGEGVADVLVGAAQSVATAVEKAVEEPTSDRDAPTAEEVLQATAAQRAVEPAEEPVRRDDGAAEENNTKALRDLTKALTSSISDIEGDEQVVAARDLLAEQFQGGAKLNKALSRFTDPTPQELLLSDYEARLADIKPGTSDEEIGARIDQLRASIETADARESALADEAFLTPSQLAQFTEEEQQAIRDRVQALSQLTRREIAAREDDIRFLEQQLDKPLDERSLASREPVQLSESLILDAFLNNLAGEEFVADPELIELGNAAKQAANDLEGFTKVSDIPDELLQRTQKLLGDVAARRGLGAEDYDQFLKGNVASRRKRLREFGDDYNELGTEGIRDPERLLRRPVVNLGDLLADLARNFNSTNLDVQQFIRTLRQMAGELVIDLVGSSDNDPDGRIADVLRQIGGISGSVSSLDNVGKGAKSILDTGRGLQPGAVAVDVDNSEELQGARRALTLATRQAEEAMQLYGRTTEDLARELAAADPSAAAVNARKALDRQAEAQAALDRVNQSPTQRASARLDDIPGALTTSRGAASQIRYAVAQAARDAFRVGNFSLADLRPGANATSQERSAANQLSRTISQMDDLLLRAVRGDDNSELDQGALDRLVSELSGLEQIPDRLTDLINRLGISTEGLDSADVADIVRRSGERSIERSSLRDQLGERRRILAAPTLSAEEALAGSVARVLEPLQYIPLGAGRSGDQVKTDVVGDAFSVLFGKNRSGVSARDLTNLKDFAPERFIEVFGARTEEDKVKAREFGLALKDLVNLVQSTVGDFATVRKGLLDVAQGLGVNEVDGEPLNADNLAKVFDQSDPKIQAAVELAEQQTRFDDLTQGIDGLLGKGVPKEVLQPLLSEQNALYTSIQQLTAALGAVTGIEDLGPLVNTIQRVLEAQESIASKLGGEVAFDDQLNADFILGGGSGRSPLEELIGRVQGILGQGFTDEQLAERQRAGREILDQQAKEKALEEERRRILVGQRGEVAPAFADLSERALIRERPVLDDKGKPVLDENDEPVLEEIPLEIDLEEARRILRKFVEDQPAISIVNENDELVRNFKGADVLDRQKTQKSEDRALANLAALYAQRSGLNVKAVGDLESVVRQLAKAADDDPVRNSRLAAEAEVREAYDQSAEGRAERERQAQLEVLSQQREAAQRQLKAERGPLKKAREELAARQAALAAVMAEYERTLDSQRYYGPDGPQTESARNEQARAEAKLAELEQRGDQALRDVDFAREQVSREAGFSRSGEYAAERSLASVRDQERELLSGSTASLLNEALEDARRDVAQKAQADYDRRVAQYEAGAIEEPENLLEQIMERRTSVGGGGSKPPGDGGDSGGSGSGGGSDEGGDFSNCCNRMISILTSIRNILANGLKVRGVGDVAPEDSEVVAARRAARQENRQAAQNQAFENFLAANAGTRVADVAAANRPDFDDARSVIESARKIAEAIRTTAPSAQTGNQVVEELQKALNIPTEARGALRREIDAANQRSNDGTSSDSTNSGAEIRDSEYERIFAQALRLQNARPDVRVEPPAQTRSENLQLAKELAGRLRGSTSSVADQVGGAYGLNKAEREAIRDHLDAARKARIDAEKAAEGAAKTVEYVFSELEGAVSGELKEFRDRLVRDAARSQDPRQVATALAADQIAGGLPSSTSRVSSQLGGLFPDLERDELQALAAEGVGQAKKILKAQRGEAAAQKRITESKEQSGRWNETVTKLLPYLTADTREAVEAIQQARQNLEKMAEHSAEAARLLDPENSGELLEYLETTLSPETVEQGLGGFLDELGDRRRGVGPNGEKVGGAGSKVPGLDASLTTLNAAIGVDKSDLRRLKTQVEANLTEATIDGFRNGARRSASVFGGEFGKKIKNSISTFVVREIAGSFVFGLSNQLQEIALQALDAQRSFIRLNDALEATGRSGRDIRSGLANVAGDLGVSVSEATSIAAQLTGLRNTTGGFLSEDQLTNATRTVQELEILSQGALAANEGISALNSVYNAFREDFEARGLNPDQAFARIQDAAVAIQNNLGVNIEDTVEGVGALAEVARSLKIDFELAGVAVAAISKGTNSTGAAAAEQLGRILSRFQEVETQSLLLEAGVAEQADFATNNFGKVLNNLLAQFESLDSGTQRSIIDIIGGDREFRAAQTLFARGSELVQTYGEALNSAGAAGQRLTEDQRSLQRRFEQSRTAVELLVSNLAELGVLDVLGSVAAGFTNILSVVNRLLEAVNKLAESSSVFGFIVDSLAYIGAGLGTFAVAKFGLSRADAALDVVGAGTGLAAGAARQTAGSRAAIRSAADIIADRDIKRFNASLRNGAGRMGGFIKSISAAQFGMVGLGVALFGLYRSLDRSHQLNQQLDALIDTTGEAADAQAESRDGLSQATQATELRREAIEGYNDDYFRSLGAALGNLTGLDALGRSLQGGGPVSDLLGLGSLGEVLEQAFDEVEFELPANIQETMQRSLQETFRRGGGRPEAPGGYRQTSLLPPGARIPRFFGQGGFAGADPADGAFLPVDALPTAESIYAEQDARTQELESTMGVLLQQVGDNEVLRAQIIEFYTNLMAQVRDEANRAAAQLNGISSVDIYTNAQVAGFAEIVGTLQSLRGDVLAEYEDAVDLVGDYYNFPEGSILEQSLDDIRGTTDPQERLRAILEANNAQIASIQTVLSNPDENSRSAEERKEAQQQLQQLLQEQSNIRDELYQLVVEDSRALAEAAAFSGDYRGATQSIQAALAAVQAEIAAAAGNTTKVLELEQTERELARLANDYAIAGQLADFSIALAGAADAAVAAGIELSRARFLADNARANPGAFSAEEARELEANAQRLAREAAQRNDDFALKGFDLRSSAVTGDTERSRISLERALEEQRRYLARLAEGESEDRTKTIDLQIAVNNARREYADAISSRASLETALLVAQTSDPLEKAQLQLNDLLRRIQIAVERDDIDEFLRLRAEEEELRREIRNIQSEKAASDVELKIAQTNDPLAELQLRLNEALRKQRDALARGDQQAAMQARTEEAQIRQQILQEQQGIVQAEFQLAQALAEASQNALRTAEIARRAALQQLQFLRQIGAGKQEILAAQAQLAAANAAVRQARLDTAISFLELDQALANAAGDSVLAAEIGVQIAEQMLNNLIELGAGAAEINRAKAALVAARAAFRDAVFNSSIADVNFALETGQISNAQAIADLNEIGEQAGLTLEQGRQVISQINGLNESINSEAQAAADEAKNELHQGQFNIGNIKVPTPFEVRRQMEGMFSGITAVEDAFNSPGNRNPLYRLERGITQPLNNLSGSLNRYSDEVRAATDSINNGGGGGATFTPSRPKDSYFLQQPPDFDRTPKGPNAYELKEMERAFQSALQEASRAQDWDRVAELMAEYRQPLVTGVKGAPDYTSQGAYTSPHGAGAPITQNTDNRTINVQIDGADFEQVRNFVMQMLGPQAIGSRTTAPRRV